MRRSLYIITAISLLLFASCGQQHQAKEVIQTFVDEYVTEPASRSSISIVKFDSTRVLSDSIICVMRTNADTIHRYSAKPIKYDESPIGRKLYVARITYTIYGAEYSDTYYLDEQLTHVVAFKSN
ncbi:MAG: hypothetical protein IJ559_08335 [Prevotella sp.]|nr:hypothetical protein [Prevotella sp.]